MLMLALWWTLGSKHVCLMRNEVSLLKPEF